MTARSAGLILAGVVLLTAAACSSGAPAQLRVTGAMQVMYDTGSGGTDPFSDGTQVVVVNSSNDVIGTGTLQSVSHSTILLYQEDTWKFTVAVPAGESRYGIQVGGTSHGTIWESQQQMQAGPALSLDLTGI